MTVVVEYTHELGKAPTIHFGKGAVHCFLRKVKNREQKTLYVLNINKCKRTDLDQADKDDWEQIGTLWFEKIDYDKFNEYNQKLGATEIK